VHFISDVVLETTGSWSRGASRTIKNEGLDLGLGSSNVGLGLEHLVLVSVLKKQSCSFSRLLLVILDGSDKAQRGVL